MRDPGLNNLETGQVNSQLIYDVGMHKGEDSEFYLRKGFRVIAFEADPDLSRYCKQRLSEYVASGRLQIVEAAIVPHDVSSTGDGKVRFYKNVDVSVWGTIYSEWAARNTRLETSSNVIEVDAIDFKDEIQRHGIPHYLKIDIEGCDMLCIEALKDLKERPHYVSLESDKTSFANIRREIDTLAELGYDSFLAVEQGKIPYTQTPPNPPREGQYVPWNFPEGASGLFGAELGGRWKSKEEILRHYRAIFLGYKLLGEEGIFTRWKFRGAWRLHRAIGWLVSLFTGAQVPGWYDTHARHSRFNDSQR